MKRCHNRTESLRQKKQAVVRYMMSTAFRVSLSLFVAAMGVLYVIQTASVSAKGFDVSELERQARELQLETSRIEVEIAQYRSLQNVKERMKTAAFVPIDNARHVSLHDAVVAKR